MKASMEKCLVVILTLTAAALSLAGSSFAQQAAGRAESQSAAPAANTETTSQEAPRQTADQDVATLQPAQQPTPRQMLKVFQLQNCEARDIEQILSLHAELAAHAEQAPHDPAQPDARVTVGYRGTETDVAVQPRASVRIATADQPDLLFVRGPEEELRQVEQLISALDVPRDQLQKQKLGHMHLIPVRSENAAQIQSVLSQLELDTRTVQQLGDVHLIIVPADESEETAANLQQVEEVISRLDREQAAAEQAPAGTDAARADRAQAPAARPSE